MQPSRDRNKVAAVTGATGVIGQAIVTGLAEKGYRVYLLVRDPDKAVHSISRIQNQLKSADLRVRAVDVSSQTSIRSLAETWEGPLHILVNNAAVAPRERLETPAGIELQFATNVLGYLWLSLNLIEVLKDSKPSRIVNVASYWAGGLDLTDLEFIQRPYHHHNAYRQSKQANRMLSAFLASILPAQEITVNSCHPGDVNSTLSNNLGFGGSQTPSQAAKTPLWLATSPEIASTTGRYFESQKEAVCPFSQNQSETTKLYDLCRSYGSN
jgi:NAD(P)-dependent dehydrogenase (short-subunit alcohol dehydrogenase family)